MNKKVAFLALAMVMSGGSFAAKTVQRAKKQKLTLLLTLIWILNGTGIFRQQSTSMYGTLSAETYFC